MLGLANVSQTELSLSHDTRHRARGSFCIVCVSLVPQRVPESIERLNFLNAHPPAKELAIKPAAIAVVIVLLPVKNLLRGNRLNRAIEERLSQRSRAIELHHRVGPC